ncbi:uncharacterized protein LOC111353571 [Spodoptera litura]|uniref:Uncharacterized protein LOC111353571 n=2 Tax=Spodoptera TaxID=7106 RepID=A0A9J7IP78_SPOLT|nr:uncharacterized protein LOC111353571 [Spodoptera litura]
MDSVGSLVDTNLRIYPSNNLLDYLKSIPITDDVPINIRKLVKGRDYETKHKEAKDGIEIVPIHLNATDIENLNKIKAIMKVDDGVKEEEQDSVDEEPKKDNIDNDKQSTISEQTNSEDQALDKSKLNKEKEKIEEEELFLLTTDIDWLYTYLQKQRKAKSDGDKDVPYLNALLQGSTVETPENQVLPRDPVLEARCVKLRAQQEAREYRKMTKSVDNVRMNFPEDSISYQLKQMNRQLIAIGQFIISIFAGFLFGFRGVEWLVGNLDFGFRLLLGVICALVIALAEIYFLAKKLNEELNVPETVQLGGPPKFGESTNSQYYVPRSTRAIEKEHQD